MNLEKLQTLLTYSPKTGLFVWREARSNFVKKGDVAGFSNQGYISIKIEGKSYLAHRLAWLYFYGKLPENEIDHINHNRSDI